MRLALATASRRGHVLHLIELLGDPLTPESEDEDGNGAGEGPAELGGTSDDEGGVRVRLFGDDEDEEAGAGQSAGGRGGEGGGGDGGSATRVRGVRSYLAGGMCSERVVLYHCLSHYYYR